MHPSWRSASHPHRTLSGGTSYSSSTTGRRRGYTATRPVRSRVAAGASLTPRPSAPTGRPRRDGDGGSLGVGERRPRVAGRRQLVPAQYEPSAPTWWVGPRGKSRAGNVRALTPTRGPAHVPPVSPRVAMAAALA